MPEKGIRSTYSQCPFELHMHDQEGLISTGSAFFFEIDEQWFLITNWHNVSGKHFLTKMPLSPNGRLPTRLVAKLSTYRIGDVRSKGLRSFGIAPCDVPIYGSDGEPLWFEHLKIGSYCDLIALPMKRPESCPEFMHNPANRISNTRIPVKPGCTVFVIGFPRSISVGFGLPLWKSGYIASEPHYDVTVGGQPWEYGGMLGGDKLPAFFIDAQTRKGMSGSPVFAHFIGSWDQPDPYRDIDPDEPGFWKRNDVAIFGSEGREFVGCYSGRITSNEEEAALGLCWRKDVIEDVCRGGRRGEHPHVTSA